jgi:hypothetical protein
VWCFLAEAFSGSVVEAMHGEGGVLSGDGNEFQVCTPAAHFLLADNQRGHSLGCSTVLGYASDTVER